MCIRLIHINPSNLDFLFNLSLQFLNLLCEGLFASGQLGDESFFLFNLTAEFTWCEWCQDIFVYFGLQFVS